MSETICIFAIMKEHKGQTFSIYSATGITGNLYIWCKHKSILEALCKGIGKSPKSVYWNNKYATNVVRIKRKDHKQAAKMILNRYNTKEVPSSLKNTPPPETGLRSSFAQRCFAETLQRYEKK